MSRYNDPWIQTYSGRALFFMDPDPADIDILDIAHALANMGRYGGHSKTFFSVAQHCTLCASVAPPERRLEALMHDASEAYLVDIPRPIKGMLTNYKSIEHNLMLAIASKFGFDWPVSDIVHDIDQRMLFTERRDLLNPLLDETAEKHWGMGLNSEPYDFPIKAVGPDAAKRLFLEAYWNTVARGRAAKVEVCAA